MAIRICYPGMLRRLTFLLNYEGSQTVALERSVDCEQPYLQRPAKWEVWPFDCHSGRGWEGHQLDMDLNWRCSEPCRVGDSPALEWMCHLDSQQSLLPPTLPGSPEDDPLRKADSQHCPPSFGRMFLFLKTKKSMGKLREIKNGLSSVSQKTTLFKPF